MDVSINRIVLVGLFSAASVIGAYAQQEGNVKMSAAECSSLWNSASPDGKPITQSQAAAYVTDFAAANPDGDKTLEKGEFMKACNKGLVKSSAASGASSGEAGSAKSNRNMGDTPHPPTNRMDKSVPTMTPDGNSK
ncbi:MAG TPA: hypothetical protein VFF87_03225 [Hyphomicrobium sp.]|nr:hypothetical protein [Hyphomicrobium sp.]